MSVGSEATNQQAVDDSSNDALVIVDDSHYPPGLWNFMAKEISIVLKIQTGCLKENLNLQSLTFIINCFFILVHVNWYSVTPTSKRGKRGRPKGSTGVPRRSRGRGGVRKSLSAAELAGAQAGMTAAYAAYGYNIAGKNV